MQSKYLVVFSFRQNVLHCHSAAAGAFVHVLGGYFRWMELENHEKLRETGSKWEGVFLVPDNHAGLVSVCKSSKACPNDREWTGSPVLLDPSDSPFPWMLEGKNESSEDVVLMNALCVSHLVLWWEPGFMQKHRGIPRILGKRYFCMINGNSWCGNAGQCTATYTATNKKYKNSEQILLQSQQK